MIGWEGMVIRIGLVWRGERGAPIAPRATSMLGPLFTAFADLGVDARPVVYADHALEEVRAELAELDGVLVWVNPIQDGVNRSLLDALLREVASAGTWVSAHPDVIDKMGTKEVLFTTRDLGWGTDTTVYRSFDELVAEFPGRLVRHRRLVVKQARGTGGNGVWRVELLPTHTGGAAELTTPVLVQRADPRRATPLEASSLGSFLEGCRTYFSLSGSLIDQPYQPRLAEGMIRVYLVHNEVVGFCHQWPKGLLAPTELDAADPVAVPTMEDADVPIYGALRSKVESEWVPQMQTLLGIATHELPAIWDADFLYGPKTDTGEDTYVLCEINVQAVWPYPPQASPLLAAAAAARARAARTARS
jgi:hypothetical protein